MGTRRPTVKTHGLGCDVFGYHFRTKEDTMNNTIASHVSDPTKPQTVPE